jgi:hypothetical protein
MYMKKPLLGIIVCFLFLTVNVYSQVVDKSQYRAIDPFDYLLDEDKARRGATRRFKSVVQFVSENRTGNSTFYLFSSLDNNVMLPLAGPMPPPSVGQQVAVYYTVVKRDRDTRVLDEIDYTNNTERGIGVVKSEIPRLSGIDKSKYIEISSSDYRDDALFTLEGDDDRYFKARLIFVSQDGILFKFSDPESYEKGIPPAIPMKVQRRFPVFTEGQEMTVYFTATKEFKDFLIMDDVEL